MRRVDQDYSVHAVDLQVVGMLPAELRSLVQVWFEIRFASTPGGMSELGARHGSNGPAPNDPERAALRAYAEAKRKQISRIVDEMHRRVREIVTCPKCGARNSARDAWCGESFPDGRGCGALLQESKQSGVVGHDTRSP